MWRGHPLPECSGFAIIEIGALRPIGAWERLARGDDEPALVANYGYMRNVSPKTAWGGVFHLEAGSYRSRAGFAVRRRGWISQNRAMDLSVGVVLWGSDHNPYDLAPPGLLLTAGYSLADLLVITAQTQTRSNHRELETSSRRYGPTNRDLVSHVGIELGSGLGAAGTAGVVAVGVLFVFAFAASGFGS